MKDYELEKIGVCPYLKKDLTEQVIRVIIFRNVILRMGWELCPVWLDSESH